MGYDKLNHTVHGIIEHGYLAIFALIAKDGARDDSVSMGSGQKKRCS